MLREGNGLEDHFSNKNKKFKNYILDNIKYEDINSLIEILELNIESLKKSGKTTISSIQDFDNKLEFIIKNDNMINNVLQNTEWFNTPPAELEINNIKNWLSKGCDTALLNVFKEMLVELNK